MANQRKQGIERVTLTLPTELLAQIEAEAVAKGVDRLALMRQVLGEYLQVPVPPPTSSSSAAKPVPASGSPSSSAKGPKTGAAASKSSKSAPAKPAARSGKSAKP